MSYVSTSRGTVVEDGAGAFALAVEGDRKSTWIGGFGVAFSGKLQLGGAEVSPYAEIGIRRMLNDADIVVSGRFNGAPGAPIVVNGVERDKPVGRLGIGLGVGLSENVKLRAGYTGEFGNTQRSSATVGASIKF